MTLSIDGREAVIGKLEEVIKATGSPKEALEETGDFLIKEFESNFISEGGVLGNRWKQLKETTRREKARLGYGSMPILVRTGELMKGFAKEVSTFSVRVLNPTKYFKYHQLGEGYNPQRVMITKTETIVGEIYEIFLRYIQSKL